MRRPSRGLAWLALALALNTSCEDAGSEPASAERAAGPGSRASEPTTEADGAASTAAPADAPAIPPGLAFDERAREAGLVMHVTSGATPARQILEVKGGGLALIDRDADGDWDVFVPNGATLESPDRGPGCRLFDNQGEPGGPLSFRDATAAAGLDYDGWGVGVAVGDVDGDGADDLYVTAFGPNALLVNDGEGRFTERGAAAGVDDDRWGTGCAFGDLDADGDLDLYVTNYLAFDPAAPPPPGEFRGQTVFGGPAGLATQADVLYANRGDGRFEDVSQASGCSAVTPSAGLNVLIVDLDRDGRQEILVGNDSQPNWLFDDAPGEARPATAGAWPRPLVDRAQHAGLALNGEGHAQATMGLALADVDGNGFPDVFSTNFSSDTNTLQLNSDGVFFDDRTSRYGLDADSRTRVGWAAGFHDLDLDGDEDLLVLNGHVYSQASLDSMDSPARQQPLLYERGPRRFTRVPPVPGSWLAEAHVDRSAVFGDLDRDGDVDVLVAERDGPLRLLEHRGAPAPDSWLAVRLDDRRPDAANRRGLGAEVSLSWPGGGARRWLVSGGGYLSASPPVARFGLPTGARGQALSVSVVWPDGHVQQLADVSPGELTVRRD